MTIGMRTIVLSTAVALFVIPFSASARANDTGTNDNGRTEAGNTAATSSPDSDAQPVPSPQEESAGTGKLNATVGALKFGFYGTLLLNISAADSGVVGGDVPLWALPGNGNVTFPDGTSGRIHDLFITARQTVLGVRIGPSTPTSGWSPSAVVEFDFFGSRPADATLPQGRVFDQPRLRVAYFQLTKGTWKFVAGQDKVIIAPLDPISLSHVAVPLGATAGNLWGWLPQVRIEKTQNLTDKTTALFQFGVLRPEFADPRLGDTVPVGTSLDNSTAGTRSTMPFFETRAAISHPMHGSTATVGIGAHYGREVVGVNHNIDSWATAIDLRVPLLSRLIFRGEGYAGSNLIPFQGGIDSGVGAIPATAPFKTIKKIGDSGGWGELTIRATSDDKNHFYVGAGLDDPVHHTLLPGATLPASAKEKNAFFWASYFRKLTNDVTAAFEFSDWQFHTTGFVGNTPGPRGPRGRANVFNVSLAYTF